MAADSVEAAGRVARVEDDDRLTGFEDAEHGRDQGSVVVHQERDGPPADSVSVAQRDRDRGGSGVQLVEGRLPLRAGDRGLAGALADLGREALRDGLLGVRERPGRGGGLRLGGGLAAQR
jgi:hypothetical protein